jgi:hypothetical protein
MASFEEFNTEFITEWDTETKDIVNHMKLMVDEEEKSLNKFINSFELTISSFKDLSDSTIKIEDLIGKILESLQFEDITGQQVMHMKEFLEDISKKIKSAELKFDINKYDAEFDKKIREELSEKISVIDEKEILDKKI